MPRIEPTASFRTLGVYITLSGRQHKQAATLRQYSEDYQSKIINAPLTSDEAYISYILFLQPRLTYPLPVSSLTQQQCHIILLSTVLPKNVLKLSYTPGNDFCWPSVWWLVLPELYTDQSYGQLSLMVGQLKLDDETGQLILSTLTHLQLQVSSSTPVPTTSYSIYAKWIDSTWVTSIWKFASQIGLEIDIEHQWTPQPARAKGSMIMDLVITFNLTHQQLQCINMCSIYLQVVLALSDITAADGVSILPNVQRGTEDTQCHSTLSWPVVPPPPAFWSQWLDEDKWHIYEPLP